MNDTITTPFQFDETLFLWLTYTTETNQVWYITSDITRRTYQLWKGKKKTKWESDNPLDLNRYIK